MVIPCLTKLSRWALGGLAVMGLSACHQLNAPLFIETWRSLAAARHAPPLISSNPEAVKAQPYAMMEVTIADNNPGIMVLAEQHGPRQQWYSKDKVLIETAHGRIIRLLNYRVELTATVAQQPDPLRQPIKQLEQWQAELDAAPGYQVMQPFTVQLIPQGLTKIMTVYGERKLQHITERIVFPHDNFTATNQYWQDPESATIWQSVQHLGPNLPIIKTKLLKPAKARSDT